MKDLRRAGVVKNLVWTVCLTMLLTSIGVATSPNPSNGRKLYKWVDEQGLTHYGDHVPPEYVSQEHHVINSQGIEVDRLEAQKSPEQIAAEDQKKQAVTDRQSRDRNLLNTYASVQEIERLRDQRMALLADQIKVTGQFLEVLNARLKKLRVASMVFKPYSTNPKAPPMSDQMTDDLVHLGNDIHTQEQNQHEKLKEDATMRKQFQSDIDRFKELKAPH